MVSVAVGLGILGFFKYFNFFIGSGENLLEFLGFDPNSWRLHIVLPVGISFYTFQSMSYTIDVYRRELIPTRNFIDYALYVSLFTQLVAGPIERATQLLPQVLKPRSVTWAKTQVGIWLIVWGLFKKLVVADNLAVIVDQIFAGEVAWDSLTVLIGIYAFAWQIYCDFSAYSDMARGLGMVLGFDIMINFRNPYFALNPSEFWRRWHISLSTWLRDYLYIPLGGNRRGSKRTYINLMLTMVLGGLWHGAAWTFVLWGMFHGGLLAIHRWRVCDNSQVKQKTHSRNLLKMFGMFHAICFGWLLFRAESMTDAIAMLGALASRPAWNQEVYAWIFQLVIFVFPLLLIQIFQEKRQDQLAPLQLSLAPRILLYTVVLFLIVTLGNTGSRAFIYFQF